MSAHVDDCLAELALGTLPAEQVREVEAHLASCRRCAGEAAAIADVVHAVALALPPVAPAPALRERLLASLGTTAQAAVSPAAQTTMRFERFVDRVAAVLELAADQARALLAGIDRATSWSPSPVAWSQLFHIEGGPRLVAAATVTGFVRVAPGQPFPRHIHIGREHVLVLQGGFRDEDGKDYHTGDDAFQPPGSVHHFVAHEGEELIYLAVIERGIEFDPPFAF